MQKFLRTLVLAALMLPFASQAQVPLPIDMDFEDASAISQWTLTNCHSSTSRSTSTDAIHAGSAGFAFHWTTTPSQYLISPEFTPAVGTEMVSFWYQNPSTFYTEEFSVGFSSTTNDTTAFTWLTMVSVTGTTWTQYTASVPAGTKYVCIRSSAYDAYYLYVDDIFIGDVPTCIKVTDLAVDPTATTPNSLTLKWSDTINTDATYTVYQINGTDITEYSDVVISTTADGYSALISGLAPMTTYTFGVKANCGADGMSALCSTSGRTGCVTVDININAPFEEGFENAEFPPACWSTSHISGPGSYLWSRNTSNVHDGNASAQLPDMSSTTITHLVTPQLSITANEGDTYILSFWMRRTSYSTLKPNEGIKVWINTTPDTIGGSVLMYIHRDIAADPIVAAAGWYQYSDTIPEDMMENFYIIFQGISEYGNASYIDDVRIRTAPTCDSPTDLTVDQIFGRTADLHWHPTGISNLIEYKKASDNVWTVASTTDSNYTFTDLEPLTAYRARVIAICSDNGQSYPSSSVSFTTKAVCQVPTNVTVAALAREATLTWRDTIANAWQIQYISGTGATADTSEIEDVTETTYTMFNLEPESPYKFRVRANCGGEDGESAWTPWKSFNTPAACQVPAGLTVTLTPGNGTVASISWTDTLAASWQLMLNSDSLNLIDVYETTYEFDNLTPEVTDTIRVRANCDNDGYSLWSAPVVFTPTNTYTVTVNDGTNTNSYVPIYGFYVDNHIQSRFIIPASSIAAMQYGSITKLTFYASTANAAWSNAEFEVYMSTTSDTAVTVVNEVDDMTQVFAQGNLSIVDHQMVVTLNQPFQYMGDNLLIAFEQPTSGSYVSCSWYGVTAIGASMGGYGSSVSQQNFRPKMTFAFEPGEAPTCEVPTNLVCTDTTGHTATLTWEGSASNVYVEYKETSAPATAWVSEAAGSSPYTLTGLAHSTSYNIRVRVECDETNYYSNTITILTENTCVDPTNLVVMPVAGSGSSVLVSWTDTMASEWELFTMLNGDTSQIYTVFESDTIGGYLVQNLIPEARYSVWVRAICDASEGDISGWIGTNFVPSASVRTTLGTPETTNSYLPTYAFYKYSFTEQIYTAAEMGGEAGVITAVDFMNTGSQITRDLDIYMIHTSDSVFENATDWFTVTAADKVFSGEVTFEGGSEWTSITFDTPFNFNGDSNVVLVVDDNTGSYVSSVPFSVYTAAGQAIRIYSDDTDYEPTDPNYTGTLMDLKNHIRFAVGEPPACAKPTNVTLTSLGVTDATLTWNDTVASSWQIMVNGDATNLISATTTSYTFANLTANTNYTVNVRAVCSAEEISEWSTPVTFRTYAPAAAVPYSTGFEAGEDAAWVFRNGTNAWMIGNATHNGTGTNALYISQNGTANTYNIGSSAVSYAFRTLDVTTPGAYYCAFDWKANGEGSYDFIRAWLVPLDSLNARANVLPDGTTSTSGYQTATPAGWIDLGGKMNGTSSWQEAVRPANITVAGTYALVFMWANDGSGGSNPPAAVDNIWFGIPTCPVVTVAGVDSASRADSVIYFSWTPGSTETAWAVQYGTNVDTVSTPEYALQHIQGNGTFTIKVRALCSDEDQSFWKEIRGKLPCVPDTVPFLNDFDNLSGTFTNSCWGIGNSAGQAQNGYQNWPSCNSFVGATNDKLLFLNKGAYVILPDLNVPLNQLYLSFDFSSGADSSVLYLGYASCTQVNFEKVVFFDTLYHVDYATEAEFRGRVEMLLNNLPAEAHNLVIASDVIGTGYYVGLNELNLTLPPACGHVENVVATPVSETSVTLSWSAPVFGVAQEYIVEYGPRPYTPGTGIMDTINTNSITLTGLRAMTPYEAYVTTICTQGDTSVATMPIAFAGNCGNISVPDTFTFSEYIMSGRSMTGVMPNCWVIDSSATIYSEDSILPQVYGANSNTEMTFLMYDQSVVALPAVNMPLDTLMLTFDMQIADPSMALVIGAVSSQANGFGTTFVPIDTLRYRDNGTVTSYLATYAGNYQYIAFKNVALDTTVDAAYVAIDNLVISVAPTCLPIRHLEVVNAEETSITFDWDDIISAGNWAVEYGPRGFATGSGTVMNVTSHPVTISGLASATGYDIYVTPVCSATNHGDTASISASTTCSIVTSFPWTEGFESASTFVCWSQSGDGEWTRGSGAGGSVTSAHSGSSNAKITHDDYDYVTKLISPVLALAPDVPSTLSFWHTQQSWAGDQDELRVYYRTAQTDTWHLLMVFTDNINAWTKDSVLLPNTSATYQIAFEMTDGYGYGVALDDITISGVGSSCNAPIALTVDTVAETYATIHWSGDATSYEVAIIEDSVWTDPTTGIISLDDSTKTFTDLSAGTQYVVGVRTVCENGGTSAWVTRAITTLEHPCLMPTNVTISNVTLTSASIDWTPAETTHGRWAVKITGPGCNILDTVTSHPYSVSDLTANTTYNVQVMTVCSDERGSDFTEAETFTTTVCQPVTGLATGTITATTAVLNWNAVAGSTGRYEVNYGMAGFPQGTGEVVTVNGTTTVTLEGLQSETMYDAYVRVYCAEGVASNWSTKVTFETSRVGINDVDGNAISLFPNPASTTVTLTGIEGAATVTVVDMNGRETGKWNVENGKLTIDVSELAQGAYFVRITGEQVNAIRKLIVR